MTDSSTGGVLVPAVAPAPLEGQTFDRFLQQVIAGILAIDSKLVRPRWQAEPPNMPPSGTNWVAIGVTLYRGDAFAAVVHSAASNGSDTVFRQEEVEVLTSFYGPDAANYASLLREGLSIAQNREVLGASDVALVDVGDIIPAPSLFNERWQFRVDMTVYLRRAIRRTYPVLNLLSAEGSLTTDTDPPLTEPIVVPGD